MEITYIFEDCCIRCKNNPVIAVNGAREMWKSEYFTELCIREHLGDDAETGGRRKEARMNI